MKDQIVRMLFPGVHRKATFGGVLPNKLVLLEIQDLISEIAYIDLPLHLQRVVMILKKSFQCTELEARQIIFTTCKDMLNKK